LGSLISADEGSFSFVLFVLMLLTAMTYQLLSNLANDYGDALTGVDFYRSKGAESRAVASGEISISKMKYAVYFFTWASIILTLITAYVGSRGFLQPSFIFIIFLLIGLLAIWSSRSYTLGPSYGYKALGDLFVILFFGPVGVLGSHILQSKGLDMIIMLPSLSIGFLAAGVLNLNNMRDYESDQKAGKITFALKIGIFNARIYQILLVFSSISSALLFMVFNKTTSNIDFLFLAFTPPLVYGLYQMWRAVSPKEFDVLLKPAAIICVLFAVSIGLGLLLDSYNIDFLV
tara:strand:- start:121 stop:987 length:867 start_codon:yes stop_codon:yes gene_type:complete